MLKLEHLVVIKVLGTGTFGRVYLVEHKARKDLYALKVMAINEILRLKQVDHVRNEKKILQSLHHPFIVDLLWTHHNNKFLYMLLEYVSGGELFSYLRNIGQFDRETTTIYSAEIVSALEYLHSLNVVYRDLKPENILLDSQGHIKLTDFGFAKIVTDRTWTLCGTPEYLAPEIILNRGHNKAVDWYALGILIFEMLIGFPPFYDENPFHIYEKIIIGRIDWPKDIDLIAKDLIKKLLSNDRTKRLGSMRNGAEDIKNHKWFQQINWKAVCERKLRPPILPKINDNTNIDGLDENEWQNVSNVADKDSTLFENF